MKAAGVIAEFDPFHNGHAYFLRRVREATSADFIIVVMSGDYTQRGNPALLGKYLRAEAAMRNGADIVLELPVQYATASAELFALGGVSILDSLKLADFLCFGTESDDMEALSMTADILASETEAFKESLDQKLREGMSYPAARLQALQDTGGPKGLYELLSRPNNILAVEYIKALKRLDSSMRPVSIKREAVDHDSVNTFGIYSSAKNIRESLRLTGAFDSVEGYLPENTLSLLRESFQSDFPVYDDDMSLLMKYRLCMESAESLMRYADMSAGLAKRMMNKRRDFTVCSQFAELVKTRNLTYTRIARAMLHALIGITKEDMKLYLEAGTVGYARLLGFRKEASGLIDLLNEKSDIPVISKLSGYRKRIRAPFDRMLEDTIRASDIYHFLIKDVYGTDVVSDLSRMAYSKEDIVIL